MEKPRKKEKNTFQFYILKGEKAQQKNCSCIIYAKNDIHARNIAQQKGLHQSKKNICNSLSFWTDPHKTTCQLLSSVYKHKNNNTQMIIAESLEH